MLQKILQIILLLSSIHLSNSLDIIDHEVWTSDIWFFEELDISSTGGLVLFNGKNHIFDNNVVNYGDLYTGQNTPRVLAVGLTYTSNANIENCGTLMIDDSLSNVGANIQLDCNKFHNHGNIYMKTKANALFRTYFKIAATDSINTGLLYFPQTSDIGGGQISLGKDGSSTIRNDGTICISNSIFAQVATLSRSGCMQEVGLL